MAGQCRIFFEFANESGQLLAGGGMRLLHTPAVPAVLPEQGFTGPGTRTLAIWSRVDLAYFRPAQVVCGPFSGQDGCSG